MTDSFRYCDGKLYCEETPVELIAQQAGAPVYIYSGGTFRLHYQRLREAFAELHPLICYSVKGCSNIHILRLFAEMGSGFDVVSGGELYRVLQSGGRGERVVYAGAGKTDEEIVQAMEAGICYFNIESEAELENIIALAHQRGQSVRAALRINPDVDPKTHRHITTGKRETKFGVDLERAGGVFEKYGRDDFVKLSGIHLHIGSAINRVEPYVSAISKTVKFIEEMRGRDFVIEAIDMGGGFGADYTYHQAPSAAEFAGAIIPLLRGRDLRLILEPGRSISANAGILLTRVLYVKRGGDKTFVIVDAAMNDLIRPVLYEAYHFIWPAAVEDKYVLENRQEPVELEGTQLVDIVGPICESGDFFAHDRRLPPVKRGDLLAVFSAGAYGFSMSSQYNSRRRAAEVLVEGGQFKIIRRRESYDDLIAHEIK